METPTSSDTSFAAIADYRKSFNPGAQKYPRLAAPSFPQARFENWRIIGARSLIAFNQNG